MTREQYDRYQEMEAQNAELRAQLAACSEEVQMLNEHLDDYRQENDYLSQVCVSLCIFILYVLEYVSV